MEKIAIILRRPPYGDIYAAEAVRHALGGVSEELKTSLIMVDGGVLLAKKGQDVGRSGFTNLGDTLKDCIDMGVVVYADKASIREHNLDAGDLPDGIVVVNSSEIAEIIKEADTSLVF